MIFYFIAGYVVAGLVFSLLLPDDAGLPVVNFFLWPLMMFALVIKGLDVGLQAIRDKLRGKK